MKKSFPLSLLCVLILLLGLIHPINAIGVFRNTTGTWYLDNNSDGLYTAGIDKEYQFGASGFTPIIGDWNGDGRAKIGVYKDGAWYLDYLGEGTWTANTKSYGFGAPGYTPVIGDWNGDDRAKIGVYKDGAWYLDYLGEGTWTANTKSYGFGAPGYTPVIGDWNGDGRAKIGVYKDGAWYLDYLGEGTWTANTKSYGFGAPGYTPVIGDWNGDGRAKIGVYKDGAWYLDYLGEGTWTANTKSFQFGQSGDSPMIIQLLPFSVAPVAAFTSNIQSGTAPFTVTFTNKSTGTGPLTYAWDFNNDGTVDSTLPSPPHTYTQAGTYSVKLTVTNGAGSDAELKSDYITVAPVPVAPVAAFTSSVQSGTAPLTVTFTDQSTGTAPLTYAWDFNNDGTFDSTLPSPPHTYTEAGTYSVKLTVTNGAGSDAELKTDYITVDPAPVAPEAGFTAVPRSGIAPLPVEFTDASTGSITSRSWKFRNATTGWTQYATSLNPSYNFPAGTYDIRLTVTGPGGSNTKTETGYIIVTSPSAAPVAVFTAIPRSGNSPLTVTFTDHSTGTAPLTYAWDFNNDGKNESSLQNPLFTYDTVGTYAVTLTVTNTFGSDSNTKTDYIIITEAPPGSSHAGVALTFDDNAPDNWYAIQGLLKNYNAHVTFFIENFGGNSEDQINTYKLIQANEHEIAFHGTHHIDAQEYLKNHTIDEYLNYEIIPGLELMRNQGFDPIDFAYPYGSEDTALTGVLQGYFLHIRGTAYAEGNQKLKDVDSIFYQYGSHQSHIYGGGIDDITYSNSVTDIYDAIDRAKAEDKIVIFYAHNPVATNPQEDQISYDRLEKVLQYVSKNNLTFYKISEIN